MNIDDFEEDGDDPYCDRCMKSIDSGDWLRYHYRCHQYLCDSCFRWHPCSGEGA